MFFRIATIGADFLTKEVVVDDRVVTMQVSFSCANHFMTMTNWHFLSFLSFDIVIVFFFVFSVHFASFRVNVYNVSTMTHTAGVRLIDFRFGTLLVCVFHLCKSESNKQNRKIKRNYCVYDWIKSVKCAFDLVCFVQFVVVIFITTTVFAKECLDSN